MALVWASWHSVARAADAKRVSGAPLSRPGLMTGPRRADAKTFQLTLTDYDEIAIGEAARAILQDVRGDENAAFEFLESVAIDIDEALRVVLVATLSSGLTDVGIQKWSISPVAP